MAELDRLTRLEKVDQMKKDLENRERVLTFFQNYQQIQLKILQKNRAEKKLYGRKKRSKVDIDENYIPPEI